MGRNALLCAVATSLLLLSASGRSPASVPTAMNYQGMLTDDTGTPVADGSYSITFTIYDAPAGGNSKWSETMAVTTSSGLFAVLLGMTNPIVDSVFAGSTRYLGIKVETDDEISPRTAILTAPYAFHSSKSDSAQASETASFADSADALTDGSIDLADIGSNGASIDQILKWTGSAWAVVDDPPLWNWSDSSTYGPDSVEFARVAQSNGGWTDDGTVVRLTTVTDSVGIGVPTPAAKLEVDGDIKASGSASIGSANHIGNITAYGLVVGQGNTVNGLLGSITGGGVDTSVPSSDKGNLIESDYAHIGGGQSNTISREGDWALIGGGRGNLATSPFSAVLSGGWYLPGDSGNSATDTGAVVAGGINNVASGYTSFVGGGFFNTAAGKSAVVCGGGGYDNTGWWAVNEVDGDFSFVGSGRGNFVKSSHSAISGGLGNGVLTLSDTGCFIGGGLYNEVTGKGSVIGGGYLNQVTTPAPIWSEALPGTIAGGRRNAVAGIIGFIGGGAYNHVDTTSWGATISGGWANFVDDTCSVVGGGRFDSCWAKAGTISGGEHNVISGNAYGGVIGGGSGNLVGGLHAVVPGGIENRAIGDLSYAAGFKANALHYGSFVWADASSSLPLNTSSYHQFIIRSSGGVVMYTDSTLTAGAQLFPGSSSWSFVSDSTLKENIQPVDGEEILEKLSQLEISRWNYESQDESVEHIGPMAQDFYRLFGLGEDDRHINTLDPGGVSLAAIKALLAKNRKLETEVAELKQLVQQLIEARQD